MMNDDDSQYDDPEEGGEEYPEEAGYEYPYEGNEEYAEEAYTDEYADEALPQVNRTSPALSVAAVMILVMVIVCIAGAVGGAIYFFSSDPGGSNAPAATSVVAQPPAEWAGQYPLENPQNNPGEILKTYTFDQAENWITGTVDESAVRVTKQVSGGKYVWDLEARQPLNQQSYLVDFQPGVMSSGYQLSAEARLVSGPQDTLFGLCFHYQEPERYWQFLVDETGRAIVVARSGGGWAYPGEIRLSDAPVVPGAVNVLTIQVTEKAAAFFVNGYRVGVITPEMHQEESLLSGSFGLAADVPRAGDQLSLEFGNFTVSSPPSLNIAP